MVKSGRIRYFRTQWQCVEVEDHFFLLYLFLVYVFCVDGKWKINYALFDTKIRSSWFMFCFMQNSLWYFYLRAIWCGRNRERRWWWWWWEMGREVAGVGAIEDVQWNDMTIFGALDSNIYSCQKLVFFEWIYSFLRFGSVVMFNALRPGELRFFKVKFTVNEILFRIRAC